jgi:hypothetical protein
MDGDGFFLATGLRKAMDAKAEKRLKVLRDKLARLEQQLAGARRQQDDVEEVRRLERELADVRAEIARLKGKT